MERWQGMDIIAGPVELIIWFCVSRPKSHYRTGKNTQMVKASSPKHPVTRFDIDNYLKFIFDCMNGIVFKDDCQVVAVTAKKEYTESPRTVIHIHELDNAIT
jgi:Holliday junction resolvase RusA-like endonuclease